MDRDPDGDLDDGLTPRQLAILAAIRAYCTGEAAQADAPGPHPPREPLDDGWGEPPPLFGGGAAEDGGERI